VKRIAYGAITANDVVTSKVLAKTAILKVTAGGLVFSALQDGLEGSL
jgi:hypothetical protein